MKSATEEGQILNAIIEIALSRRANLPNIPTIASLEDIENALRNLPAALPSSGIGDPSTFEHVKRDILPALAMGHNGPR